MKKSGNPQEPDIEAYNRGTSQLAWLIVGLIGFITLSVIAQLYERPKKAELVSAPLLEGNSEALIASAPKQNYWQPPSLESLDSQPDKEKILYGRELIVNTSHYLGEKGIVGKMSNGMNCQNCHLEAGTKVFGNNYAAVAATYPKFRARSGTVESIDKRINDCFERSLNGKALDTASREMQAIKAYILWVGKDVAKGEPPQGSGLKDLAFLDRPADTLKGKIVYETQCKSCHAADGQGIKNAEGTGYSFPPLWGKNSYNIGAGLYRLSNFAKYVKYNMPQGVSHDAPILTDEQAWDVAAYVNSQQRPHKDLSRDWYKIEAKPFDHPFGPYADGFGEAQHKYGSFKPILEKRKQ